MKKSFYFLFFLCSSVYSRDPLVSTNTILHSVHFNEIILTRFYYLQRLNDPMQLLFYIKKKETQSQFKKYEQTDDTFIWYDCSFENPLIIKSIKTICDEGSYKDFYKLWRGLKRFQYIEDNNLITEYSLCLIVILCSVLPDASINQIAQKELESGSSVLYDIEINNDVLEMLTFEQVLDALLVLVDEVPEFIEKSDKAIEKKKGWYWMVAPIGFITFVMRAYSFWYPTDPLKMGTQEA